MENIFNNSVPLSEKSLLLSTAFKKLKLNFTKINVVREGGFGINASFEINPSDFLKFAKKDLKQNDERGQINAITNAKRAIDCQTDLVLKLLGIDFDKELPNAAKHFINQIGTRQDSNEKYNLKLIEALGIAPIGLVSKVRKLRHQLEHYYQIPLHDDAREALELAELYINSTQHRLDTANDMIMTNEVYDFYNLVKGVSFNFLSGDLSMNISINYSNEIEEIKFFKSAVEFYFFLKISMFYDDEDVLSDCIKGLLTYIQHPQAKLDFNVQVV
jgi:hypothetical protein